MKKLMMFAFAATLATTACSKDKTPSCEDVFNHTKKLAPAELQDMMEKSRAQAIEKCGKLSAEAKQCAMKASTLEELQKCPRE